MVQTQTRCDTYDDDTLLEFHWTAANGMTNHYNVYLSVDDSDYVWVGTSSLVPTAEAPYALPVKAEDGKKYQLKVEAESTGGVAGPESDLSDVVWCKLRSPGDTKGQAVGDMNADKVVNADDIEILLRSWGAKRGDDSFDYKADLNYDDSVDILDMIILSVHWQNHYSSD